METLSIKVQSVVLDDEGDQIGSVNGTFELDEGAHIDDAFALFGKALVLYGYNPELVERKLEKIQGEKWRLRKI